MYARKQKTNRRVILLLLLTCFVQEARAFPQATGSGFHLRIGVITTTAGPEGAHAASVARGVRLGAAEAKQTAALFGDRVDLVEAIGTGAAARKAALRMLSAGKIAVLIGTTASDAEALSQLAESHHAIFFNAASRSQALRSTCRGFTFHIEATDPMYANAARLGHGPQPGSMHFPAHSIDRQDDSVVLWGPTLERFGASQLNQRYLNKYGLGMDGSAWAGWASVKIAADAAFRAQSALPQKLLAYLTSPTSEFDGHKGWPLTFRPGDHQLRQPLYMVVSTTQRGSASPILRDVPELHAVHESAGANDGARPSDKLLDALIASPDTRTCRGSVR